MTRFRISLAILLVLLGISMGSMAAVRPSGNAVLEAVQQVSETASPTAAQCEACLLYTSPSPREAVRSRIPSCA